MTSQINWLENNFKSDSIDYPGKNNLIHSVYFVKAGYEANVKLIVKQ